MGKIIVNGNSGSIFAKKRKRVKGADHHLRREVKQYNPFVVVDSNRNNYSSFYISNIFLPNKEGESYQDVKYGSWDPILVHDPMSGHYQSERIGNQYFLKYMRFKGYIWVSDLVYRDVNWRLVLYRCNDDPLYPADALLPNTRADGMLKNVFLNTELFSSSTDVNNTARHNFHKKLVNVDNKDIYARKVIASGTIPQTWNGTKTSDITVGAQSGVHGGLNTTFVIGDGRRYIPMDIKVNCNDWIKVNEVRYYICLEVDSPQGLNVNEPFNQYITGVSEVNTWNKSLFIFNFFCRSYFIDP